MAVLDYCEQSNKVNEVKDGLLGEIPGYVKSDVYKNTDHLTRNKIKKRMIVFAVLIVVIVVLITAFSSFVILTTDSTDKECIKDIPVLNGKLTNETGFLLGDEAKVECNQGYQVNGSETITCLPSGHWNETPICLPNKCNELRLPEHVKVDARHLNHELNEVNVVCDDGFNLIGQKIVNCQTNGSWSRIPTCKPVDCGFPPVVSQGIFINLTNTTYNSTFNVKCDVGYELTGASAVICEPDGKWNNLPKCTPVSCGTPIIPNNAHIFHIGGTTFNKTVSFKCNHGFTLVGYNKPLCKSSGDWSGFPECKRECLSALSVTNGWVIKSNYIVNGKRVDKWLEGDIANVECHNGYKVNGSGISECLPSGQWSDGLSCVRKQCASFKPPANAEIISPTQIFHYVNDEITISCLRGFRLNGNAAVKCQESETWTIMPTCTPITCDLSPLIRNDLTHDKTGTAYKVDDTIHVTCRQGHNLKGDDVVRCGLDGNWIRLPKCEAVSCGTPTAQNAYSIGKNNCVVFGCNVSFRCKHGYNLIGNGNSVCQANGQWSNDYICKQKQVVHHQPNIGGNNNNGNNNSGVRSGQQGIPTDIGLLLSLCVVSFFVSATNE